MHGFGRVFHYWGQSDAWWLSTIHNVRSPKKYFSYQGWKMEIGEFNNSAWICVDIWENLCFKKNVSILNEWNDVIFWSKLCLNNKDFQTLHTYIQSLKMSPSVKLVQHFISKSYDLDALKSLHFLNYFNYRYTAFFIGCG